MTGNIIEELGVKLIPSPLDDIFSRADLCISILIGLVVEENIVLLNWGRMKTFNDKSHGLTIPKISICSQGYFSIVQTQNKMAQSKENLNLMLRFNFKNLKSLN